DINNRVGVTGENILNSVLSYRWIRRSVILSGLIIEACYQPSFPTCLCIGKRNHIFDELGFLTGCSEVDFALELNAGSFPFCNEVIDKPGLASEASFGFPDQPAVGSLGIRIDELTESPDEVLLMKLLCNGPKQLAVLRPA